MYFDLWQCLPPEMKEQIFDKCDIKDLHACLKIDELRPMAQFVLGKSRFWKDGAIQPFQEFLKGVSGTRFSTADDVQNFLRKMEGSINQRPFLNGVVIYVPPDNGSRKGIRKFHAAFGELVNRYAKDIRRLVYCMFNYFSDDDNYEKQLSNICQLNNLESLAIYHGAAFEKLAYPPKLLAPYKGPKLRTAPMLKELLIFPFEEAYISPYPDLPHIINYLVLIPNFIQSLECLQFDWKRNDFPVGHRPSFNDNLKFSLMPNLKKLKVILFRNDFDLFEEFCRPEKTQKLQEVSLLVGPTVGNRLGTCIKFLDGRAPTLESIHLDFDVGSIVTLEDRNLASMDVPYNWTVKYPKLKRVSIGMSTFSEDFIDAWNVIGKKFKNLEVLTLEKNLVEEGGGNLTAVVAFKTSAFCLQLWEMLPVSLEEIRVPHLGLVLRRGQVPPNLQ